MFFLHRIKYRIYRYCYFLGWLWLGLKRFVLRQNYGDKIEAAFEMTRQGVRWRFQRLFNEIYTSAYSTIYWVESNFGTELRSMALEIAKERVELRKEAQKIGKFGHHRVKVGTK